MLLKFEFFTLMFYSLQDVLPKEDLLNALYLEFINRVNEVGVDVNKAVSNPHTAALVQFISGLGPRKGGSLLKVCVIQSGYCKKLLKFGHPKNGCYYPKI